MAYEGGYPRATSIQVIRGRYSFDTDGGAVGDVELTSEAIPANAVVLGGFVEVDTVLTGTSATVGVKVEAAGDIVTAGGVGSAPWSSTGRKDVTPDWNGAGTVKTTEPRKVVATIGTAALTAGAFDVVLFYVELPD